MVGGATCFSRDDTIEAQLAKVEFIDGLSLAGLVSPRLRAKAGLARIGRYYATESMLVWDPVAGRYDADATPSTGKDTLFDHYAQVLRGEVKTNLGDHAVF